MERKTCGCLGKAAELCSACGTPVRWFEVDGRRRRYHIDGHRTDESGARKTLFRLHGLVSCRRARVAAMVDLRKRGVLCEDSSA